MSSERRTKVDLIIYWNQSFCFCWIERGTSVLTWKKQSSVNFIPTSFGQKWTSKNKEMGRNLLKLMFRKRKFKQRVSWTFCYKQLHFKWAYLHVNSIAVFKNFTHMSLQVITNSPSLCLYSEKLKKVGVSQVFKRT